jgi:hypothetical protein
MSSSYMSDQSPLTLTVPAEPTENDFIDNYDLDGNDNDYSLSEKIVHFLGGYTAPEHWLACLQSCFRLPCWLENQQACIYKQNSKEMACLLAYKQAIAALDSTHFRLNPGNILLAPFRKRMNQ